MKKKHNTKSFKKRMMEIFIQGTKRDNSRHRNHCKKHKTKSEENSTWQLGKGRPLQIKDL